MKVTIFSRLAFGFIVIFLLCIGASAYSIVQLYRQSSSTRNILDVDNLLLEYEKKFRDSLLSQVRYERKFAITRDFALYEQYSTFRTDFKNYLTEAGLYAGSGAREILKEIRAEFDRYQKTVSGEVEHIKAGRDYPSERFKEQKETAERNIIMELDKLQGYGQAAIQEKIKNAAETASTAGQVATLIGGASLVLIFILSLWITRSIARPLSILNASIGKIARGEYDIKVNLSSPPEVAELASAFNHMSSKLKELDQMKADFFSLMAHELRTPLSSIKEGIGILRDGIGGIISDKQRKVLSILSDECQRLIGLVNSLLDLSRLEAGMTTYKFEKTDIAGLIHRVVEEVEPLVDGKKINLDVKVGSEIPFVKADIERLLQVLRNLIGNAIKFTPEGGRVEISARPTTGIIEVSVRDTGPGIPSESLPTIFDKYKQAKHYGLNRSEGTGLGLAVAKHIVMSHGGKIWAESEIGQGSTFTFVLPL